MHARSSEVGKIVKADLGIKHISNHVISHRKPSHDQSNVMPSPAFHCEKTRFHIFNLNVHKIDLEDALNKP